MWVAEPVQQHLRREFAQRGRVLGDHGDAGIKEFGKRMSSNPELVLVTDGLRPAWAFLPETRLGLRSRFQAKTAGALTRATTETRATPAARQARPS